jgi:ribosomal protein S18 acetylase RimI-like enzyme
MIIRPFTAADVPGCAQIMAENPLWQRYGITPESAAQRLADGLAQNAAILVASTLLPLQTPEDGAGGRPAGFVWYVEKGAFFRSGYIMLIGVDPAHQGQGIGEALMDEAERRMFEKTKDVFLLVSDFNEGAQRFYQRRGYVQVGALPGYVLPDVAELIFRKTR